MKCVLLAVLLSWAFSAAQVAKKPATVLPSWSKQISKDKMDGSPSAVFSTRAINANSSMIVRCRQGKTELYVTTPRMVASNSTVRIKYDNEPPFEKTWIRSDDYHALFAPDMNFDSDDFADSSTENLVASWVRAIASSKRFMLEYHPYERTPEVLEFNVTGLKTELPTIAKACLWEQHEKEAAKERAVEAAAKQELAAKEEKERVAREKRDAEVQEAQHREASVNEAAKTTQQREGRVIREESDPAAREARAKAILSEYVHPCSEFPNYWCWVDPSAKYLIGSPKLNREDAINEALEKAKLDAAFRNLGLSD